MPPDEIRASDAEREDAVTALRAAVADGRLTLDEFDDRAAAAYAARTRGELARLLADLPSPPQPRGAERRRAPRRIPGRIPFTARWRYPARGDRAAADLVVLVAPFLHESGYELMERTPERLVFLRRGRPAWTIVVAIVAFPVGLLALLARDEDRIAIEIVDHGEATSMVAQGVAPLTVRRAFADLE